MDNKIYEQLEHEFEDDDKGKFLSELSNIMPYQIPQGYFENLNSQVFDSIKAETESEIVTNWGKLNPYEVPAGYFDNFESKLLESIFSVEEKLKLPKSMPFEVPNNYFEELPAKMVRITKRTTQKAKVIFLHKPTFLQVLKAGVAAVLVIGLGFGIIMIINTNHSANPEITLASVPKDELKEYVQQNYLDVDMDFAVANNENSTLKFDKTDIVRYLNETGWDGVE